MNEREIIRYIEEALAGREPSEVPFKDIIQYLPDDPAVKKVIEVYRDDMADGPLMGLDIIARRSERKMRRRGADSVGPGIGDTQIGPATDPDEETND